MERTAHPCVPIRNLKEPKRPRCRQPIAICQSELITWITKPLAKMICPLGLEKLRVATVMSCKGLKLSGCWWKEANAGAMLYLRVARANDLWSTYWSSEKIDHHP
jgi:hypothetical protein